MPISRKDAELYMKNVFAFASCETNRSGTRKIIYVGTSFLWGFDGSLIDEAKSNQKASTRTCTLTIRRHASGSSMRLSPIAI
jgi:hypothetical protein